MIPTSLLSDIHAQLRRQMNADVAASLRRAGVTYKVAFGVPSMRLRDVAALYEPSVELAEALWAEDIREARMLATRLYPPAAMQTATARRWIAECTTDELADQLVMNLLAVLPWATELTASLLQSPSTRMERYVAMKLVSRLPVDTMPTDLRQSALRAATTIMENGDDIALRTAAYWAHDVLAYTTDER